MKRDGSAGTKEKKPNAPKRIKVKRSTKYAPAYALLSALVSLIAVGGLFLGYFFRGAPLGRIVAGGEPILRGALFGVIVEIARGSVRPPVLSSSELAGPLPLVLYALVLVLTAVVLFSLAFAIAAFVLPRSAKKLAYFNAYCVLGAYGALFLVALLYQSVASNSISDVLFDVPTLLICIAVTGLLFVAAALRRGSRAVINLMMLGLSLAGVLAFAFPHSPLTDALNAAFRAKSDISIGTAVSLLLVGGLTLINLVISAGRLSAKGWYLLDVVRFGLQLVAAIALPVSLFAAGAPMDELFTLPLSAVLLFAPPVIAILTAAFTAALGSRVRPKVEVQPIQTTPDQPLPEGQTESAI